MKQVFYILSVLLSLGEAKAQIEVGESSYPYWPSYQHLETENLDTITAQKWMEKDHVVNGWDWSLPDFVEPSPRSLVGLQRIIGLDKKFAPLNLPFKSNATGILWVKWRDLEPTQGNYDFQPLIDRIKQANTVGSAVILRILCHSKSRGKGGKALSRGEAPLWLEDLGVNFLPQKDSDRHNLNFDPSHPVFHQHYLALVEQLAQHGIPEMVKAAYVGYASHSFGDEGIGPFGETHAAANDTVQHVRDRLDVWAKVFKGQENKVFMGGPSEYGFEKGFGVRRGFVEMYMYRIPDREMGQYINESGYLSVDEEAPILKYQCFNGEVNEEYEEAWATSSRNYRFGQTTASYPYRYFTSTLRLLQMRCTYVHTTGHLLPKMLPFLSLELGRTVEDTPDVWTFLRTSYLRGNYYQNNDYKERPITSEEGKEGIATKNFERWLYQRDAPGYETEPAIRVDHPIEMWMIQEDKRHDFIARSGKKIGFDVDDRWEASKGKKLAIKVTYIDQYAGELLLNYDGGKKPKSTSLKGDQALKTATFIVPMIKQNSMDHGFDFTLEASGNTERIVVSMVRVVAVQE